MKLLEDLILLTTISYFTTSLQGGLNPYSLRAFRPNNIPLLEKTLLGKLELHELNREGCDVDL